MTPRSMDGRLQLDPEVANAAAAAGQRAGAGLTTAVIGRRIQLSTQGAEPNLVALSTQLITARVSVPRQWLITLMQPVTSRSGVQPWLNTFDGDGVYPPVAPHLFTAPQFPANLSQLRVALRWGAGGAAFQTQFDYPIAGGVFGLTADVVDLNVALTGVAQYAAALDVPVVGAFMVPGQAADTTPLRWVESRPEPLAANASLFYGVKPYARKLRISAPAQNVGYLVSWFTTAGTQLWDERRSPATVGDMWEFDVVPGATVVSIQNLDAVGRQFNIEWEIGLV